MCSASRVENYLRVGYAAVRFWHRYFFIHVGGVFKNKYFTLGFNKRQKIHFLPLWGALYDWI